MKWVKVADKNVRHCWEPSEDCLKGRCEVAITHVSPDWYAGNGTPICSTCGTDLVYAGTEIQKRDYQSKLVPLRKRRVQMFILIDGQVDHICRIKRKIYEKDGVLFARRPHGGLTPLTVSNLNTLSMVFEYTTAGIQNRRVV